MKVFVSSTYLDLREYREKINESLRNFGEQYTAMEIFGARSEEPKTVSLKEVNDCDVLIGIYAHRYGWVPEGDKFSITQQEYELAREKGKETLCYIVDPDHPWPPPLIEGGEAKKKLEQFKQKIKTETTPAFFTTPENLISRILGDLARTMVKLGKAKAEDFGLLPHPPQPYLAHLYPIQENFTGRITERKQLTDWLNEDPQPVFAYVAIGGMGKSALSWYWLQEDIIRQNKAPDGIIWWSFFDKESSFERFLHKAIAYASAGKIDPTTINSAREQVDVLSNILSQKRFLLVLDGLERLLCAYAGMGSPYQGEEVTADERQDFRRCVDPNVGIFLRKLASGYPKTKSLLTSRLFPKELDGLAGCKRVDLKRMNKEDAVEFFHRQDVKGSRAEIEAACEPFGYHPLSLRLLSGLIAQDPEHPGDIKVWRDCCPNLEELKDKEGYIILEVAYNALDEKKQKFVSKLAAFRTPMEYKEIEIFNEFGDKKAFGKVLRELQDRGLLFFDKEKKKYDLHPIVRSYCYDRLKDKEGVHSQLRDYFASVPEPEKIESIDDLQPVIELYHHTVGAGRYDEAAHLWYERLSNPIYFQFGDYAKEAELLEALMVSGAPNLSDESYQAVVLNAMATDYSLSGQPRRAVPLFEMVCDIYENVTKNKGHLAVGLGNLASMAQIPIGDLESAESNLRRRIEIAKEIKDDFSEANGHHKTSRVFSYLGKFSESIEESVKVLELLPKEAHQQIGTVWAYRSLRALLMDDTKEALRCAQKALEFAKKTADDPRFVYPIRDFIQANRLIGASYVAMEKMEDAEKPLNFAITECRKINLVEIEADILLSIAKLRFLQDKKDESLKLAIEALEIANRCGYVLQQADIHLFFAEFYKDRDDIPKAKEHAELAKLRARQKIDVETGDYITKKEGDKYIYKPAFDKATNFLKSLEG